MGCEEKMTNLIIWFAAIIWFGIGSVHFGRAFGDAAMYAALYFSVALALLALYLKD